MYLCIDLITQEPLVAKRDELDTCNKQLEFEAYVYSQLAGGVGIPTVRWFGEGARSRNLVMDIMGPSLDDFMHFCGGRFSLKTVLMLADQLITRIEFVHSRGFVIRDVKPGNFVLGTRKLGNQVFAIDFGLAKRYRSPDRSGDHVPFKNRQNLTGTLRYGSITAQAGISAFASLLLPTASTPLSLFSFPRSLFPTRCSHFY